MTRHDVLGQRPFVRPVRDGAVGNLARELQHERRQRRDQDRRRRGAGHVEHRREVEELAVILDVAGAGERRSQHLDVLTCVAGRARRTRGRTSPR